MERIALAKRREDRRRVRGRVVAGVGWCIAILVLVLAELPSASAEPDGPTSLTITSGPPPTGRAGVPYAHSFTASPPAPRWEVSSGAVPPGLVIDPLAGTLTGTPTNVGHFPLEVTANDAAEINAVAAGRHVCSILDDDSVRCWGTHSGYGAGDTRTRGDQPGEMGDALPAVDLGTGRTATTITAGGYHSCALLDDAAVKCWGNNGDGQLGLGDKQSRGDHPGELGDALPAVDLGTGRTAASVSVGGAHTCALRDDGTVVCWGLNNYGQLGRGDTAPRGDQAGEMGDALIPVDLGTGRTATAISAGNWHSCAVLDNGTVKCWGRNSSGELGLGGTNSRGDQPGEMGDALPTANLGLGRTAVSVAVGFNHSCALLDNGLVKCWGDNSYGKLGLGDTANRGDQVGEMGNLLPAVDLGFGRTATSITTNDEHTCALLDTAAVRCWGYNASGALGLGDTENRGDDPGEMGYALPAVDLGFGRSVTAVTAGDGATCAVLGDQSLRCWGYNGDGRLGLGDTNNRGDGPGEMGSALPAVDLGTTPAAWQAFTLTVEGVTSMTPKAGLTTGGTPVTLTGLGFADVTGVRFGPTPATSFIVVDDTTITAVAPARPVGLVNVWLDSPSGSNANLAVTHFAYQAPPTTAPTVTSVTPNTGDVAGGQTVTISGSGFLSATSVAFGQTAATTYTIVNDTTIIATTPARGTPALVNVWVTNPHGTNPNQPSSWYAYRNITGPPPTVTSLSPSSGPTTGGETLTITGTGFTGTTRVDLGSTTATSFTVVDDTTLTVTTPARPAGLVNVWVRTNNGANPNQPSSWYRYQ